MGLIAEAGYTAVQAAAATAAATAGPAPFHSTQPDATIHHTSDACPDAQDALFLDVEAGTGGLPECEKCAALGVLRWGARSFRRERS
jgi:hypothetical protein